MYSDKGMVTPERYAFQKLKVVPGLMIYNFNKKIIIIAPKPYMMRFSGGSF